MSGFITAVFALVFFFFILLSIALHEVGHLVPAKLFGVKVPQYFVGFGRTLWSKTINGTEYGIKAIPLGGYVRLVGMYPKRREGARDSKLQRIADEAREAEHEQINWETDDGRLLYQKPVWQKIIIMFGGPAMNLVLAFLIFSLVFGGIGTYQPTTTVRYVQDCVIPADRPAPVCHEGDQPTPAKAAGLAVGDQIVSFNGVNLTSYQELTELIRANQDREAKIVVLRNGKQVALKPVHTLISQVRDEVDPEKIINAGWLGVAPQQTLVHEGPGFVVSQMWQMTKQSVVAIVRLPIKVYDAIANWWQGKPRDKYGPVSIVGASVAAGEVAANDNVNVTGKIVVFASLLGSLNLFLAIFNLVPLPPLDGGHIAGAIFEGLRRCLARIFRRPDPGYADTAKLLPITYLVAGLLIVMSVALILLDVVSPISLF